MATAKTHPQVVDTVRHATAAVAALGLFIAMQFAFLLGRVQVIGQWAIEKPVARGNVLFIANHPSFIETIVLPALFWDRQWRGRRHEVPWSIADKDFFGAGNDWLYPGLRCIPVERGAIRSGRLNTTALRSITKTFRAGGSIILYPEGGRTCNGANIITTSGRQVRTCDSTVVRIAKRNGTTIIPIWVDHGPIDTPESLWYGLRKLLFRRKLTITFGRPVAFSDTPSSDDVAYALLHTKAPDD